MNPRNAASVGFGVPGAAHIPFAGQRKACPAAEAVASRPCSPLAASRSADAQPGSLRNTPLRVFLFYIGHTAAYRTCDRKLQPEPLDDSRKQPFRPSHFLA